MKCVCVGCRVGVHEMRECDVSDSQFGELEKKNGNELIYFYALLMNRGIPKQKDIFHLTAEEAHCFTPCVTSDEEPQIIYNVLC